MNDEIFEDSVVSLIKDKEKRKTLSENIADFANTDANKLIYDEVIRLIKKGR